MLELGIFIDKIISKTQGQLFMSQTANELSTIWSHFQTTLFPWLKNELGALTKKQPQLIEVIEILPIDAHIPSVGIVPKRPLENRYAIARAFVAQASYNLPTTEMLMGRLNSGIKLHRLCRWEKDL